MKLSVIIISVLFSCIINSFLLLAQEKNIFEVNLDFSIAKPNPTELQSILEQQQSNLIASGIDVNIQSNFDYDVTWSGSILYQFSNYFLFGIGGSYLYSDAYILYGDINGNYDATGKLKVYSIDAVSKLHYQLDHNLYLLGELSGGLRFIESKFTENIELFITPNMDKSTKVTNNGNTWGLNGFIGLSYLLGNFEPYIQIGYRYLELQEVELNQDTGSVTHNYDNVELEHNLSSIVLKIGLGYNINF
jgi:hypothetical protein